MLDDFERGLLSAPIDPPPGELIIDVLLAADASGADVADYPITYAARLHGVVPDVHQPSSQLVLEAERSNDAGGSECAGTIQILLTAGIATDDRRGTASVIATLGPAEVRAGAGLADDCYALRDDDESIAVDCSLVGVRRGTSATTGILALRLRWSGTPGQLASMPEWAQAMLAAMPTPAPMAPIAQWTGALSSDRPAITIDTGHSAGMGIFAEDGTIRYIVALPVIHRPDMGDLRERPGSLHISVSDYTGPRQYGRDLVRGSVELLGDGSLDGPTYLNYLLADCDVTVSAGEDAGQLSCGIGEDHSGSSQPFEVTGHLSASWQTSTLTRDVGPAVDITWRLGGEHVSQGTATVYLPVSSHDQVHGYHVPSVRVGGTPAEPETIEILIRPFMGDLTYTGDAVMAGRFDDCEATISDGGTSGVIHCGGSTTLDESWRFQQ